jgi:hypothetical protein
MTVLIQGLVDTYGLVDKRRRNIDDITLFRVDGRDAHLGADNRPFGSFCTITAQVMSPPQLTLGVAVQPEHLQVTLGGNVPVSDGVRIWCEQNGAELSEQGLVFRVFAESCG